MEKQNIVFPANMNNQPIGVWNMSIGENLRRLRRDKGLTQGDLSELCGVKPGQLSEIENDKSDTTLKTIYKLMKALKCTPNDLLLDTKEISMDATLALTLERASKLDDREKAIIIEVVDMYCTAKGLSAIMNGSYDGTKGIFGYVKSDGKVDPVIAKK